MNDVWLPRIIVLGLLGIAMGCIVASAFEPTATWCSYIVTSVVSGLLGYVVSGPQPKENNRSLTGSGASREA